MKATIYDIAREAGVSIATVSQVINGKGKISEKRRAEIMEIMERLHYQPSAIAAALTGKQTYTLGLPRTGHLKPVFRRTRQSRGGSKPSVGLQRGHLQYG